VKNERDQNIMKLSETMIQDWTLQNTILKLYRVWRKSTPFLIQFSFVLRQICVRIIVTIKSNVDSLTKNKTVFFFLVKNSFGVCYDWWLLLNRCLWFQPTGFGRNLVRSDGPGHARERVQALGLSTRSANSFGDFYFP